MLNRNDAPGWRHTLGSPDLQEVRAVADHRALPPPSSIHQATDGAEPTYTIYAPGWYAARKRVASVGAGARELTHLLDGVERGWHALRALQVWAEANADHAATRDGYGHLLVFIEADLVDSYREIALGAANLVPGWANWDTEADPEGLIADIEMFVRYLTLLHLSVQVAPVPEEFATLTTSIYNRLAGWGDELAALTAASGSKLGIGTA